MAAHQSGIKSEERLIPTIRAALAQKLGHAFDPFRCGRVYVALLHLG